jgi:hypothetical protein
MLPISNFEPTYSPDDFCRAERISKKTLYELWRQGIGPDFYLSGNRKRIPHQARLEWQRKRMADAQQARA